MYNQNDSERRWRGGDVLDRNVMSPPEMCDNDIGHKETFRLIPLLVPLSAISLGITTELR